MSVDSPVVAGSRAPRRFGESANLDLLRTAAVLFVVVSHVPAIVYPLEPYAHVQALGLLGVAVFFVHTCLVLMLSLERQTESLGVRRRALVFFVRRAFRIYPLSVAVVLLTYGFFWLFDTPPAPGILATNLLLAQNLLGHPSILAPLWSLPFEVQMYLVLPLLFSVLGLLPSARKAAALVAGLWALSIATVLAMWALRLNYHLLKYLPCFLPGVLSYALWRSRRRLSPAWLFGYVLSVGIAAPLLVRAGAREHVLAWFVCAGLGALIPLCRELRSPALARIGEVVARYSYGIYLVHVPCIALGFFVLQDMPAIVRWGTFLASTIVLSYLAYHLVEKPGIELGRRLGARLSRSTGRAAAASSATLSPEP